MCVSQKLEDTYLRGVEWGEDKVNCSCALQIFIFPIELLNVIVITFIRLHFAAVINHLPNNDE